MASGGGTKVGNAYITVTPKLADGFDSKLKSQGTPSGHEYGNKFSEAAGKAMSVGTVALGNILSNAIQAVASNIGQVFSDAFNNYADYEQLSGGVEKIFDQADIEGILKDANNAYKDLNMSANEYLSSINQTGAAFAQTMGDQKGYDTARRGMLAISDYASGTGLSIELLNEKYKMIARSTSSYQSIADQFSGILPQTNKDFLEQAQAAGFLSKEYKSLTEVPIAEYQEALTKMLEKGVADMGLAGNTAMESAETITGSLAMVKGAWANMLTELGKDDGDVAARMQDLVDAAKTALFGYIDEATGEVRGGIIPRIQTIITSIADYISTHADEVANGAVELFNTLIEAIAEVSPAIFQALTALLVSLAANIVTHVPEFLAATGQLMLGIVEGIANGLVPAMSTLEDWMNGVLDAIGAFFASIGSAVSGAFADIASNTQSMMAQISSFVSSAIDGIKGFFNSLSSIPSIVTGIFNSVKQAIATPINAAKQIVADAINAIKNIINGAHLELPRFALPHFVIDGGELPWGIGGQGSPPSIDVQWYAKGGIVDGISLIGAGESGPEMILPQHGGLMDDFSESVAAKVDTAAVVDEIRRFERMIGPIIADYAPSMTKREFDRAARTAVAYG